MSTGSTAISPSGIIVIVIVGCGACVLIGAGVAMHYRSRNSDEDHNVEAARNMRPDPAEQKKYMEWVRTDNLNGMIKHGGAVRTYAYPSSIMLDDGTHA